MTDNERGSPFPAGGMPVEVACLAVLCRQTEICRGVYQAVFQKKAERTGGHDIPCRRKQANLLR
ncbi:hypothetical protein AD944_07820 [Acetobacter tropicalis]|nr:hypothetical protein AD944_07820 [Acetobacter tropicalis]